MKPSVLPSSATRDERGLCLREAIRRRLERQRAERLRELQDAVATTWSDGLPHGRSRQPA